jgi:hypothetical protein
MATPNPSLQPTRYGWLRQPSQAAELKRYAARTVHLLPCALTKRAIIETSEW